MSGLLAGLTVKYTIDFTEVKSGIAAMKADMSSVSSAAQSSSSGISSAFGNSISSLLGFSSSAQSASKTVSGLSWVDGSKTVTNTEVAQAKLTLLESKVTEAREKLQTLQNAADAGKAVTGIPQAQAELTLLEAKAQEARTGLQELQQQEEQTANTSSGSLLSGFKSTVGGLLDFGAKVGQTVIGIQALGQTAIGLGTALLTPNASMEQTTVAFQTLLGKGKQTQDFLQQMKDFAAATPFEFPEVATAAQHMLAFGFQAKQVIPILTNIGDAMGSMGKGSADIDHIVGIFGQMHAAGKLNAGDMMQLADEGIPAWKMLADAMGKTVPEVQKLTSSGLIPADTAIKAVSDGMHKMFGGGMAAQANTFNGLLSTLQDNAGAAMRAFTGPLFDAAKAGLTTLGNLVSSKQFQDFATGAGQQIATVFGQIGGFISTNVVPAFQQLGPLIGQVGAYLQGDNFQGFIADVQTVGNQIQRILTKAFQDLAPYLPSLKDSLTAIGGVISGTVVPALDNIVFPLGQFLLWMQEAGPWQDVIKAGLIGIGVAFAAIQIGTFIATIPALAAGFITWAVTAGAAAISTIALALPIILIGAAIALVVAGIVLAVMHWGEITAWLQGVWGAFSSWFMGILGTIGAFFTGVWNGIASFFVGLWTSIFGQAQAGGAAISGWWTGLWNGIVAGLQAAWAFIVNAVRIGGQLLLAILLGPIIAIGALFVWLYNHNYYFKAMIDAIVGFVQAGIVWLQGAWTGITTWIAGAWQSIVNFATVYWNLIYFTILSYVLKVQQWLQATWNSITGWLGAQWNQIASFATVYWNLIYTAIQSAILKVTQWLQTQWNTATSWLQGQWNLLAGFAQAAWTAVSTVFSSIWSKYISQPLQSVWNSISKWFTDLGTSAQKSGQNFISMLVSGITSGAGSIWNAVTGIASTIWKALGFHSPAKEGPASDADTWMPNLVNMFSSGLTAGIPKMQEASNALAGSIAQPYQYPVQASPAAATIAAASNSSGGNNGRSGNQTFIFEMDGYQFAQIVGQYQDEYVRLKFGPGAR